MGINLDIQELITNYIKSRDALKEAGILRTDRNLQGDYAEWIVAKKLNLTLSESTIQKGYDATDDEGKTYQVKSRMVYAADQQTSFDFQSLDHKFDFLIAVFFNKDLGVIKIIKVPYEAVLKHAFKNKTNYRFRWYKGMSENAYIKDIT
ncbi:hypothetical protein G6733_03575 [Polynucleobacter paneuropaeus]|nr:hypothetical protein G6733_03575 [Polynucleobacter paneuropaeus]